MIRIAIALLLLTLPATCSMGPAVAQFNGCPPGFCSAAGSGGSSCTPFNYPAGQAYQSLSFADGWTAGNVTLTTNSDLSPDCTQNASRIVETSATGNHNLTKTNVPAVMGIGTHTFTVFIKNLTGTRTFEHKVFNFGFGSSVLVFVNPVTCTQFSAPAVTGSWTSPSVVFTVINGYCQVALTFTSSVAITQVNPVPSMAIGSNDNYAGDGTSSLALWGYDLR